MPSDLLVWLLQVLEVCNSNGTGIGIFFTLRPWACTPGVLVFKFFIKASHIQRSAPLVNIQVSEFSQSEHIWTASTQSKKHYQHPRRPNPFISFHTLPTIPLTQSHPQHNHHPNSHTIV